MLHLIVINLDLVLVSLDCILILCLHLNVNLRVFNIEFSHGFNHSFDRLPSVTLDFGSFLALKICLATWEAWKSINLKVCWCHRMTFLFTHFFEPCESMKIDLWKIFNTSFDLRFFYWICIFNKIVNKNLTSFYTIIR